MRNHLIRILAVAILATAGTAALAGGPIYTYDYANRVPYVWHLDSWPNGAVPYYTDLGTLGRLSNTRADELVQMSLNEWNNVPTSSVLTTVAGDFASIGLPDIVCPTVASCNANLVVGPTVWNGGGIDVIYDNDGRILQNFFGIFGALGISGFDFADEDSNEILEGWTVLNGPSVQSSDPNGDRFRGVITHELGHTLNLAHSQVNGAVFQFQDTPGATGCPLPYPGAPTNAQIETMYPFINVGATATGTGLGMATVDRIDDIAAISDLYPAPGWPASHGTIRGTISSLLNIRGNGTGDARELTGVNVIARNVADPFNDFTSYFSGQVSKGQAGADGSFEMHGLTPGAQYVLYVDNARNGSFSVPRLLVLPGPEEYYNGAGENGNGESDNRCVYTTLTAQAGAATVANIVLNRVKGAPEFIPQPTTGTPTDITPDGGIVVGTAGPNAWVWNLADNTVTNIGGFATGGQASISDDGSRISFSAKDAAGIVTPAVYENGAWTLLPPTAAQTTPCNSGGALNWGSSYDISGDGSTIVGLAWGNACATAGTRGFIYKNGVTLPLPKSLDAPLRAGRANAVNYDGSVVAGWDDAITGIRRGAFWTITPDGTPGPSNLIEPVAPGFAGEALEVTRDGSTIIGLQHRTDDFDPSQPAWHYSLSGECEDYPNISGAARGAASAISDDGQIVGGWSDVPIQPPFPQTFRVPTLWTPALGWTDLNVFLNVQGTYAQDITIANPLAMSSDGRIITGWANSIFGAVGWVVKTPKVVMCHANPGSPGETHTIDVSFPGGLTDHLSHGDTLGLCQYGGE